MQKAFYGWKDENSVEEIFNLPHSFIHFWHINYIKKREILKTLFVNWKKKLNILWKKEKIYLL